MRTYLFVLTLLVFSGQSLHAQPSWELTWADEFNAKSGRGADLSRWTYDLGGGGWGNDELQCYTNSTKNVYHDGKGNLVIEARKESVTDKEGRRRDYSSGRLLSKGKFSQAFGRFEMRAKITVGKGIWPAFWMLGDNFDSVGWPECGEIDILENVGHEPGTARGTVHGPGYSGGKGIGGWTELADKSKLSADFHVYSVEWEPEEIRWYLDGKQYFKMTPSLVKGNRWVFDHPHFMLINLAVGGQWPGSPNAETVFPQRYIIDYVRVYKDPSLVWNEAKRAELTKKWAAEAASVAEALVYRPKPQAAPGRVEAEHYAEGGEGVAYHDNDAGNQGGEFRRDGVDIQSTSDDGGGVAVGWTKAGEWLEYTVISKGGRFAAKPRVAAEGAGGTMDLVLNGKTLSSWTVPNTGGWQSWQTLQSNSFVLPKGKLRLRLQMRSEGPVNQSTGNLNWIDLVAQP